MNFDVEVRNPNAVILPLTQTDYSLDMAGKNLLTGKVNPEGSIPANGSARVSLPVSMTFEKLLSAGDAIRKTGGDVPYALEADLALAGPNSFLGPVRVPIRYSGTLPLKTLLRDPAVLLRSASARKLAELLMGAVLP